MNIFPTIYRLLKCLIVSLMILTQQAGLAHSSDLENFRQKFIDFYNNDANYDTIVKSFDVSPQKEIILLDHLRKVFSNEQFINLMVDEMDNQGILDALKDQGDTEETFALSMGFGYQFVTELSVKGIKRMSDERIREYLNLSGHFFANIPPRYCRALMGSSISQEDEINASINALRNLNASDMRFYFELTREAIFSELNDWPLSIPLNDYQINTGQRVFEKTFTEAIDRHHASDRIIVTLLEPQKASDADFCLTGKVMMDIIYDLEGMAGNWFRRSFVESM